MTSENNPSFMRLKRVLLTDKTLPGGLLSLLVSDLTEVLESYFEFDPTKLDLQLELTKDGSYQLNISAPVERVFSVKVL